MNTTEPSLFLSIKADLVRFWALVGGAPLALVFVRTLSYQVEGGFFSLLTFGLSLLSCLPELCVLMLFLKYVKKDEAMAPVMTRGQPRLSVQTVTQAPRAFFWSAVKVWGGVFFFVWLFTFRYYGMGSFFTELLQLVSVVGCYSFALKETRIVQRNSSHDSASRLLGAAAIYFIALNLLVHGLYTKIYLEQFIFNRWLALLGLALVVVVLFYEQRRYMLAQSAYHNKNPLYQIEAIDPLHPTPGIDPLAYSPKLGFGGVLSRVESSEEGAPFRSSEVKVPLFLVPMQPEPFMGFLSRRLYLFVGLFLLSLLLLFMSF